MGQLVDGVWQPETLAVRSKDGRFVRADSQFRDRISADGASGFKAEAGRYHLYISLACPWAHRTLIFRHLKGLEELISISIVEPFMAEAGWAFGDSEGCIADPLFGAGHLHEIYSHARADYSGRVTVPVLWDRERATIVNNESAEIIRMMNSEFGALAPDTPDFCPVELRGEIDEVNKRVYTDINNGVYRTGFAGTQPAYEEACDQLFAALDWVEARLRARRYLCGERLTEADWRLFPTLVRFDCVYFGHFKCNIRRIADYPCLSNYLRELYQVPGIAGLCNFRHIKEHYYRSHESINPTRIVPSGPEMDLHQAHDRDRL
jgi:putative glutathione S-transferase